LASLVFFSQAWAFQILSDPTGKSAIWAAQRLPDDHMTVVVSWQTIWGEWVGFGAFSWCLFYGLHIPWEENLPS